MRLLDGLARTVSAPDDEARAEQLSRALADVVPHRLLSIVVSSCSASPLSSAGPDAGSIRIGLPDLLRIDWGDDPGRPSASTLALAGRDRPIITVGDPGVAAAALVLVLDEGTDPDERQLDTIADAWTLVSAAVRTLLAGPDSPRFRVARVVEAERARVVADLAGTYAAALTGVLAVLRTSGLDDHAARRTATDVAATALVELEDVTARERSLGEEPLDEAYDRLRTQVAPVVRFATARVELAEATDTLVLPATVAQAARGLTRAALLELLEQSDVRRVRVSWESVDGALVVRLRDDGPGRLERRDTADVEGLALAVGGQVLCESVPGWGTSITAQFPLVQRAPSAGVVAGDPLSELHPRELDVLAQLALGHRNRDIAERLFIAENTVKFHLSNIYAKLGVRSRSQAAVIAREAGLGDREQAVGTVA